MQLRPYQEDDQPHAIAFSKRLECHGKKSFAIPTNRCNESKLSTQEELILALDEQGVHGGYCLRRDSYHLDGSPTQLNYFGYPVSEGIIDKSFAIVGLALQRDIQKRVEFAYGLGGGGLKSQVNQLKIRGGWAASDVPFFFYVNRLSHVLRKLPTCNRSRFRSIATKAIALSGLGSLGLLAAQSFRTRKSRSNGKAISCEIVKEFPDWVNHLYEECISSYRLLADRNLQTLKSRFPSNAPGISRGVVSIRGNPVGWFASIDRIHHKQEHFGELKVGLITDFLAQPHNATAVITAAVRYLRSTGADLIVCNASHADWQSSLLRNGFIQGPSNFPFLASPALSRRLAPLPNFLQASHLVRADGDKAWAMLPTSSSLSNPGPLRRAS